MLHIQNVDRRRQLVAVSLKRFDARDDSGKPIRNLPQDEISVVVYVECK
jgi:hypothetical protein